MNPAQEHPGTDILVFLAEEYPHKPELTTATCLFVLCCGFSRGIAGRELRTDTKPCSRCPSMANLPSLIHGIKITHKNVRHRLSDSSCFCRNKQSGCIICFFYTLNLQVRVYSNFTPSCDGLCACRGGETTDPAPGQLSSTCGRWDRTHRVCTRAGTGGGTRQLRLR